MLPESAHPDKTRKTFEGIGATAVEWIGGNPNKGLSVVAFDGWELRIDESYDPGYQWVMPVHVTGPAHIRLLAVWDMNHRGRGHQAARQSGACRASIPHYDQFLSGEADITVISGDFNNSVVWDTPSKRAKFGDFMDQLEARGFSSAYHSYLDSERGAEDHPTLWWLKNVNTTYHIDYTFVSPPEAVHAVEMGAHADWIAHSDHSPMTVELRTHRRAGVGGVGTRDERPEVHHIDLARRAVEQPKPPQPEHKSELRPTRVGRTSVRVPLQDGALPDMLCGVNGEGFAQEFRPTSFTAEWVDGVLVEVRIWGPRVLKDGSLGRRELDHRWKVARALGGVDIGVLPTIVSDEIRSKLTE